MKIQVQEVFKHVFKTRHAAESKQFQQHSLYFEISQKTQFKFKWHKTNFEITLEISILM